MKESCIGTGQCLLKQGVARISLKAKTTQQVGVEVYKGDEVTIAESGVELESKKDEESGKRKLAGATTLVLGVRNSIAKAQKIFENEFMDERISYPKH
jgi:hypothetical protein